MPPGRSTQRPSVLWLPLPVTTRQEKPADAGFFVAATRQTAIALSPLARRNDANASIADRFQVVVQGWEIVNAYSELVDPLDQRQRLEEQAALKVGGDEEAMDMDEDYLAAMEHGMPPMSGWGMGIDRFCALLTNSDSLRDVVLFPLLKPQSE